MQLSRFCCREEVLIWYPYILPVFLDDTRYSVVFPDLNWLATSGSNETDAMNMAVECLAGYLYTLKSDADPVPPASSMVDVSLEAVAEELDADMRGTFINMVSVDVIVVLPYNSKRDRYDDLLPHMKTRETALESIIISC